MNDLRTGALIRAARRHRRLRQSDVAAAIGISQTTVSLVERGHFDVLSVGVVRRVASYVEVDLPFAPRFRGSEGDRLLDARHAALVDAVVALLRELGWQVEVEHSYNHYGDRGSVDVLAWRDDCRALLIVEVKTELVDVQQLCRSLDVKRRVVPPLVARELGWKPASLGCILVLPDERARRAAVARHAAVFDVAFGQRTVVVKRWLKRPEGWLRGILFLSFTNGATRMQKSLPPKRIRRPRSEQ